MHSHPATAAWNRLQASAAALAMLEIWRETPAHQPASVYRLELRNGGPISVYAKRCDATSSRVERTCYEEVVPELALSSPTYYGSIEEADGSCWLFLEDVGRERFSAHDPTHVALASRWLARLHRSGATVDAARQLPEAGPPRYLQHLRQGRAGIQKNLGNPGLCDAEREMLVGVIGLLDRAEGLWDAVVRACSGIPETVVHGDFRPKNVRIREEVTGPVLYALDWELAGWGVPVADLAPARGTETTLQIDPAAYAEAMRGHGPPLDAHKIERLSLIGYLFRRLAAVEWETLSLHFEDPFWLIAPISCLRSHQRALTRSLAHAETWLR